MPITDEEVSLAQRGDPAATRLLFGDLMPVCGRIACTLTGLSSSGRHVLKRLVDKSKKQFDLWRDAAEARRWFLHQTILLTRDHFTPHPLDDDLLMQGVGGPDVVQYRALVGAFRKLTAQQQEAFVLRFAEGFKEREAAVAMDCSVSAVQTHLEVCDRSLRPMAGKNFEALVQIMKQVHQGQPLELPQTPETIAQRIRTTRTLRMVIRIAGWVIVIGVIAMVGYVAWSVYPMIKT